MPDFQRPRVPFPRPRPPGLGQGPAGGGVQGNVGRGNGARAEQVQSQGQGQGQQTQDGGAGQAVATGGIDELMLESAITALLAVVPESLRTYADGHLPGIVRQAARDRVTNANQVAYILATAEHESKFTKPAFSWSEPLVEDHNQYTQDRRGRWRSRNHLTNNRVRGDTEAELDENYWDDSYGGRLGNQSGTADAANFKGRGYVQITGRENYERMSGLLRDEGFTYELDGTTWGTPENPINLTANPTHVNRSTALASKLLVLGLVEGSYTGRAMDDYINDEETDFTNARRVVNGDVEENGESIAAIARRYAAPIQTLWPQVFQAPTPTQT